MAVDLEHEFVSADGWPRDLQAFAMASLFWGGFLLVRAIFALRAGAPAVPFEDVISRREVLRGPRACHDGSASHHLRRLRNRNPDAQALGPNPRAPLHGASNHRSRDLHSIKPRSRVAAHPRKDRINRKSRRPADRALPMVPSPPPLTSPEVGVAPARDRSFANDMLSDAAPNQMLEAVASVRKHHDQVYSKLISSPHDIDIRRTRSDLDNILHLILEGCADCLASLALASFSQRGSVSNGSGTSMSWIGTLAM